MGLTDSVYTRNGYENREDYLMSLSEDFGIDYDVVVNVAGFLGESEDFDGLVSSLEDISLMA